MPSIFGLTRMVIIFAIVVSIGWLLFTILYADKYAQNYHAKKMLEKQHKWKDRFPEPGQSDPFESIDPEKLANTIRTGAIVATILQLIFLYGVWTNNMYLSTTFIIWIFLCTVFAFKLAMKQHHFWIQGSSCLSIAVLTCFYVHMLYSVK